MKKYLALILSLFTLSACVEGELIHKELTESNPTLSFNGHEIELTGQNMAQNEHFLQGSIPSSALFTFPKSWRTLYPTIQIASECTNPKLSLNLISIKTPSTLPMAAFLRYSPEVQHHFLHNKAIKCSLTLTGNGNQEAFSLKGISSSSPLNTKLFNFHKRYTIAADLLNTTLILNKQHDNIVVSLAPVEKNETENPPLSPYETITPTQSIGFLYGFHILCDKGTYGNFNTDTDSWVWHDTINSLVQNETCTFAITQELETSSTDLKALLMTHIFYGIYKPLVKIPLPGEPSARCMRKVKPADCVVH